MIEERTTAKVQSTITGDVARMGIAEGSEQHIMSLLTDLYGDPEGAVLREYATNAYDAHIEAGVTRPIEVILPNPMNPVLTIRDFGAGLDADDIHTIYSQYGASTKRGTNTQVGMLGLGCKSGLTYAQQFTVISVKGGVQTSVIVSRNEDGTGSMTIIGTQATEALEGTIITIPARAGNQMATKAVNLFRFWPEGSVLVNGAPPKRFEGLKVAEGMYLTSDEYSGGQPGYVVMGNVAYPHRFEGLDLPNSRKLVCFVPIGAVQFTPSRESLHYTTHTKKCLAALDTTYSREIVTVAQQAIDTAKTPDEALTIASTWYGALPAVATKNPWTWRGITIPFEITCPDPPNTDSAWRLTHVPRFLITSAGSYRPSDHSFYRNVALGTAAKAVFVHGWPRITFTHRHKSKLNQWVKDRGLAANTFLLSTKRVDCQFISGERRVHWDTIKAVKLPPSARRQPVSKELAGSYDCYVKLGPEDQPRRREIMGKDLNPTKTVPVFWVRSGVLSAGGYAHNLAPHYPRFILVALPANRLAKFNRILPTAVQFSAAMAAASKKFNRRLTADQRIALQMRAAHIHASFAVLDAARVDDPDLKTAIRCARLNVADLSKRHASFISMQQPEKTWKNPLHKYPLVRTGYGNDGLTKDHTYIYVNAVYAAQQQETT